MNKHFITEKDLNRIYKKKIDKKEFSIIRNNNNFRMFAKKLQEYFNPSILPADFMLYDGNGYHFFAFNLNVSFSNTYIKIYNKDVCNITILPHKYGVELYCLEMYQTGKGYGSIFMNLIKKISEETNIKVYLIPGDPSGNRDANDKRRRDFYHRFGYKRLNKSDYWCN
jgi:hypothetical protein